PDPGTSRSDPASTSTFTPDAPGSSRSTTASPRHWVSSLVSSCPALAPSPVRLVPTNSRPVSGPSTYVSPIPRKLPSVLPPTPPPRLGFLHFTALASLGGDVRPSGQVVAGYADVEPRAADDCMNRSGIESRSPGT